MNGGRVRARHCSRAIQRALGTDPLPFVAENLGVITPEVEALRHQFGFPGMAILQFAFGTDPQAPDFRPHNYPRNLVVYTGTHDNDTTVGWWTGGAGHSTRSTGRHRAGARLRAPISAPRRRRGALGLHSRRAGVGGGYRDRPGAGPARPGQRGADESARLPAGNWRWRLRAEQFTADLAQRLAVLAETYERT